MEGLRLSHAHNYGAWDFIGIARAVELSIVPSVSNETKKRMKNYFTRHLKDKQSGRFGNTLDPSRGYMAWLNWGGDPGMSWANSKLAGEGSKRNPTSVKTLRQIEPTPSTRSEVIIGGRNVLDVYGYTHLGERSGGVVAGFPGVRWYVTRPGQPEALYTVLYAKDVDEAAGHVRTRLAYPDMVGDHFPAGTTHRLEPQRAAERRIVRKSNPVGHAALRGVERDMLLLPNRGEPRLRLNPLPSSAEYAAFERMFENPSKAFYNISNEVKKQGGWNEKTDDGTLFVILAGPYAGTYIFGRPHSIYVPEFTTRINKYGRGRPLWMWRQEQVNARLKDLPDFIAQQLPELMGDVPEKMKVTKAELARLERIQSGAFNENDDPEDYMMWAPPAVHWQKWRDLEDRLKELESGSVGVGNMDNPVNKMAQKIYLLSQVGGVDFDSVIAALKAQPKRLLTFKDYLQVPSRREERARWARALLTTYSPTEALKAWFPRVPGAQNIVMRGGKKHSGVVRYAMADFPNWLQVAEKLGREEEAEYAENYRVDWGSVRTPLTTTEVRELGQRLLLKYAREFQDSGVSRSAFRAAVKKYTPAQLGRIVDTFTMALRADTREVLAETVEGRRVLQHIQDEDWREVMRDHDAVLQAERTAAHRRAEAYGYMASVDEPALERFHGRGRSFILPEGVRPLTTRAEFDREGSEMGHCVAHYFNQRRSWCFAFLAPDGSRATLELTGDGDVAQFYGPGNSGASAATRKLLSEFMQRNADNIKAMRKGAFPPKELVQMELTNYPGEGVAQNPYRRSRR